MSADILLLILSIIAVVLGFITSVEGLAPLWCAVIFIVLIWYIYWQSAKNKALEKELKNIKDKLDSLSNDKTDKE